MTWTAYKGRLIVGDKENLAPNRQAPEGRRCLMCSTILSIYNHSDFCWQHDDEPRFPSHQQHKVEYDWRSHGKNMYKVGCRCRICREAGE